MADPNHQDRFQEELRKLSGNFFATQAGKQSLITITSLELINRNSEAIIGVSIFPETAETQALSFLSRKKYDLVKYLQANMRNRRIPRITITLDAGEKNRQRIVELLAEDNV